MTAAPGHRLTSRSLRGVERLLAARSGSLRARRLMLLAALALLVVVTVLSFRSLPSDLHPQWWPVPIVVLVTTPLTAVLNAAEFRVMAGINGHSVGWLSAIRLTVVAGAANLLPVPGGVVVRTQALHLRGSSYRRSLAANASAGIVWLGAGCVVVGALLVFEPHRQLAAVPLVAAGLGCLLLVTAMLRRADPERVARGLTQLLAVELGTILVGGSRLFLLFVVLGVNASVAQSIVLTSSQIIAAAVGIFPAGLGLRELLAGGIGAVVALPAGAAIAVTALDRVATQLVLGLIAAGLLLQDRGTQAASAAQANLAGQEPSAP